MQIINPANPIENDTIQVIAMKVIIFSTVFDSFALIEFVHNPNNKKVKLPKNIINAKICSIILFVFKLFITPMTILIV